MPLLRCVLRKAAHGLGFRLGDDGVDDVVEDEGRLGLEEGGLRLLGERVRRVARRAVERLHLEKRWEGSLKM